MTLVELLVVLSVVAILFAIAAPTVSNHIALQHMRGSTQQIVDILRDARSSAIDEGVPRYVVFTPPRTVQAFRYNGTAWVSDGEQFIFPSTVQFDPVSFKAYDDEPEPGAAVPGNAVYFDTRGVYPYTPDLPSSYTITLRGSVERVETVIIHTSTGQVINP
jgi:type II secretory pathway pseudopilin PulG